MNTYIGIDNIQKSCLVMVCKLCYPNGEIAPSWREKLLGEVAIKSFFEHFWGHGFPVYFATTWLKLAPDGLLLEHQARGAQVLNYHPWELEPIARSTLPARYRRAEQLALQAIHDTHFVSTIRNLRSDFEHLDSKLGSLICMAGEMRGRLCALECKYPDPMEIPF